VQQCFVLWKDQICFLIRCHVWQFNRGLVLLGLVFWFFLFIMFCLCCWPVELMCALSSAHNSISNPRLSTQYISIMMIAFHHLLVCLLVFCTCVDGVGYYDIVISVVDVRLYRFVLVFMI